MPRRLIKRFTPDAEFMKNHKVLGRLGSWLHDPSLWHLNRRSASWAIFIGLVWAYVPSPGQMVFAVVTAIIFRVNVPISFAMIWLTNPITIPPMFYFSYLIGTKIMGVEPQVHEFELSWAWIESLGESLVEIYPPLLVGSLLCGVVLGAIGFAAIRLYWRWHVVKKYRERQAARANA